MSLINKILQSFGYYTKADVVSFGNYIASEERKELFRDKVVNLSLKERLRNVYHADWCNWINRKKP